MVHFIERWKAERVQARQAMRNISLWNAIQEVVHQRHGQINGQVQRALDQGADVNAIVQEGYGPASGKDPLTWAVHTSRWELVDLLLKNGADPHVARHPCLLEWRCPSAVGQGDDLPSYTGHVPLFATAVMLIHHELDALETSERAVRAIETTLETWWDKGVDPTVRCGDTTLLDQMAMRPAHLEEWYEGWLVRFRPNEINAQGCNALYWLLAKWERQTDEFLAVYNLLEAGANPYQADARGITPLHLLVDLVEHHGKTPMMLPNLVKAFPWLDFVHRVDQDGHSAWSRLLSMEQRHKPELITEAMTLMRPFQRPFEIEREVAALRATMETVADMSPPAVSRQRARL